MTATEILEAIAEQAKSEARMAKMEKELDVCGRELMKNVLDGLRKAEVTPNLKVSLHQECDWAYPSIYFGTCNM